MQFFEALATLVQDNDKVQFQIGITVEKGTTVVSVVPKTKDKAWTPFVMRGTPQELDQEFETQLDNLKAGLGHISNAATYAETIKKEVVDTAKAATKTTTVTPPAKKTEAPKTASKPAAPAKVEAKKPEPKKQVEPEPTDDDDAQGLFGDE